MYMDSLGIDYEIIIGSNGSLDNTAELGYELDKKYRQVIFFHISEKGVGEAFKRAVQLASYDWIISLDMDLSVDINFVKESLELMGDYDIIIGSKQMGEQDRSFFRKLPSTIFIFLVKFLLGLRYRDYSLAAKVYKKEIIEKNIKDIDKGTSYVIDIIYHAYKQGYNIIEIPVKCDDRRRSKFNILKEAWYRFWRLIRLWLRG